MIDSFGTITSPGSPGNYPQNRDCEWHLAAPNGKRINLHFFSMQLETHSTCDQDFLAIYDGGSTDDQQLMRFCNTSHPEPLTSGSNELLLHFHSDGIGTDAGFQIHYTVVEGIPGCGGTWTGETGEIASPKVNGGYARDMQCDYLIRVPPNERVRITFVEFGFERSGNCMYDYLAIYEGASRNDPLVGRFCGEQLPAPYESKSNVLTIEMRTDWSISGEGFRLRYETREYYHALANIMRGPVN